MEKVTINATHRKVIGKQVGALRRQGKLPAVLYGHHIDPTPILLDLHDATIALSSLTSSSLVTILLDGEEHAALVREKQRDFIKNVLLHVDFQAVSSTEKIRAEISIEITGLAPAIKNFNGIIINGLSKLEVECFPQDLPERITVDVSNLNNIGDAIYARDIKLSDKVEILTDLDEMVVLVTSSAPEEEVAEAPAEGGPSEPEVIEKGKKEEEVSE
jgi:large subunit ribosomal protein L25